MNVAILTDHNNYCGREYMAALAERDLPFEVVSIGEHSPIDAAEEERCAGLWRPAAFATLVEGRVHRNFPSLKDPAMLAYLLERHYDLGIQGGTGILRGPVIDAFRLGILNFHPGDLPAYRGCSAPEWQLIEGRPVISTCHLVDKGIDTGRVYRKQALDLDYSEYHVMRAGVYPHTARFLAGVVGEIAAAGGFVHPPQIQDESAAQYRKYAGDEAIALLKTRMQTGLPKPPSR